MDIQGIRAYFAKDVFATDMGIYIEEAEPGSCTCTLPVTDKLNNAKEGVQGGAIFTLADFAFAVASNCDGTLCVTHSCSITYLLSVKGTKLTACAKCITKTRRTTTYEVFVSDDTGRQIAVALINGQVVANEV